MLRILTASSIIALAAVPAIAQQAGPMATPSAPEAAAPAQPAQAPADPATPVQPADPAPQPAPAAATDAVAKQATVQKLVETEFPTYDANKNGDLEQAEFSKWVLALHSASGDPKAQAMDDKAKAKWAKDAFASADADKSKKVSQAEMSTFLLG